ncbi:hypothetical protein SEVIR_2G153166v4 [Setaria viridis]
MDDGGIQEEPPTVRFLTPTRSGGSRWVDGSEVDSSESTLSAGVQRRPTRRAGAGGPIPQLDHAAGVTVAHARPVQRRGPLPPSRAPRRIWIWRERAAVVESREGQRKEGRGGAGEPGGGERVRLGNSWSGG